MSTDGLWSIGGLAERAGVTVKTVRFYSDRGLLPEAARSGGGHRRYGPDALDRLRLIRSLRALDLPVPEVGRVLGEQDALGDSPGDSLGDALEGAIAGQLREIGSRLTALRWREAALRLVAECAPAERPGRLRLIGAMTTPPSTAPLARFWRGWLPARMSARVVSATVEQAVPPVPEDPTPAQVLAFARLQAFVSAPCDGSARFQPEAHKGGRGYRPELLYDGLAEAYALAAADVREGRAPHGGEALDCFVAAHAAALGVRDTPGFRRGLGPQLAAEPRLDAYWNLVAELTAPPSGRPEPTPGAADDWLRAALRKPQLTEGVR
ncbi:MerR family transcriptional regulator [Streptomyces formicae]|uniref:Putative MerR-family transcriptional regulator n=1 Tax=Streptomyces formicae TaxID=1616117 RepID=A0A291QGG8_9ACTN|nr:MerR family transcriptional regulator [Streptomyces formicae]ATL30584.1 putative MerR-family transcriptional regulator [Streptomyces formicae]